MKIDDLRNYIDKLHLSSTESLTSFEKNFIYISTGFFIFSIMFLRDILGSDELKGFLVLIASWSLLIVSILLILFSFIHSARVSDRLVSLTSKFISTCKVDKEKNIDREQYKEHYTHTQSIHATFKKRQNRLRIFSIITFILGIAFFGILAFINQ